VNIWWNSWSDFWAMGQHGFYVWGSYGVAACLVVAEVLQARHARRQALREVWQAQQASLQDIGAAS
jgi:heme exporter protein D